LFPPVETTVGAGKSDEDVEIGAVGNSVKNGSIAATVNPDVVVCVDVGTGIVNPSQRKK